MPVKLTIHLSSQENSRYCFEFDEGEVIVGRAPDSHLHLPFPFVSAHQFTIVAEGDSYLITDGGSTNGTIINDKRLARFAYQNLKDGDIIKIGELSVEVSILTQPTQSISIEATGEELRRLLNEAFSGRSAQNPRLKVIQGPDKNTYFSLSEGGRWHLGSSSECEFQLSDTSCEPKHLSFSLVGEKVQISPLGEALCYLNGSPLFEPQLLGASAELNLGATTLRFEDPLIHYVDAMQRIEKKEGDLLSTQQIETIHYPASEAPPNFSPPDRLPEPAQPKLLREEEESQKRWSKLEMLIFAASIIIVFFGILAVLVLLNLI